MSYLKFNHLFVGLMLLSALSAFVLHPDITNPARAQVQNLFAPVAWPVRSFAGWLHDKVRGREVILYWRDMQPNQTIELPLSLVAAVPGHYTAPASRAYLYYTDEFKDWAKGIEVAIEPKLGS